MVIKNSSSSHEVLRGSWASGTLKFMDTDFSSKKLCVFFPFNFVFYISLYLKFNILLTVIFGLLLPRFWLDALFVFQLLTKLCPKFPFFTESAVIFMKWPNAHHSCALYASLALRPSFIFWGGHWKDIIFMWILSHIGKIHISSLIVPENK